ncbi:hypothetical protein BXT92_08340 [Klebsiella pneumoniae]|nr:hypothetical protein BXT92_08340 [Klebsiella pneumoniae]
MAKAHQLRQHFGNATHLGHYGTQFCQILCIHSLRHQLLYSGGENHRN